jgi:hypothetical protein
MPLTERQAESQRANAAEAVRHAATESADDTQAQMQLRRLQFSNTALPARRTDRTMNTWRQVRAI